MHSHALGMGTCRTSGTRRYEKSSSWRSVLLDLLVCRLGMGARALGTTLKTLAGASNSVFLQLTCRRKFHQQPLYTTLERTASAHFISGQAGQQIAAPRRLSTLARAMASAQSTQAAPIEPSKATPSATGWPLAAVATMTSVGDQDANFATCEALVKVSQLP